MTGKQNQTRTKASAVFFAFIMVTSMMAGSVVLAGSAAAAASNASAPNSDTVGDTFTFTVDVNAGETVTIDNKVDGEVRQSLTVTDGGSADEDDSADGTVTVTLTAGKTYGGSSSVVVTDSDDNTVSDTYTTSNYDVQVTDEVTHGETTTIEGEIFEYPGDPVENTVDWSLQYDPDISVQTTGSDEVVLAASDTGDGTFQVRRTFNEVNAILQNDYPSDGATVGTTSEPAYIVYVDEDGSTSDANSDGSNEPADYDNDGFDAINTRLDVSADYDPSSPTYKDTIDVNNGQVSNADGGLDTYELRVNQPGGTAVKTTDSAQDGSFEFTLETNDAGVWQLGTNEGSFIGYDNITVGPQEANLTFSAQGSNQPGFSETYDITLRDSEDSSAIEANKADGGVEGYLNITGPFESGSVNGAVDKAAVEDVDNDGDDEVAYIHVITDASGEATFDATPDDSASTITAELENADDGYGNNADVTTSDGEVEPGLEVTDDASDTPDSPDYVGSASRSTQLADPVNIADEDVEDPRTDYDETDVTANPGNYRSIFGDAGPEVVEVIPLTDAGNRFGADNSRLGYDANVDLDEMTAYRVQFELRDETNQAIVPGSNDGEFDQMTITGAGIDAVISQNGNNLEVSGTGVLDARYSGTVLNNGEPDNVDVDGADEYVFLIRPTEVTEENPTIDHEIDVNGENNVSLPLDTNGLNIAEFQVNDETVDEVQPNSEVNLTSVVQDATQNDASINNGRVRLTQNGTQLANFDARTANTNDGEYTFENVNVGPRGFDTNGDGIGEEISTLDFTAYQYTDADDDQSLVQREVNKAAVEELDIALDDTLQIEYDAANTSTYSGTQDGNFTLTRGVEYDQIAFDLTEEDGTPVDLTEGLGGNNVNLNDIAYNGGTDEELITLTTPSGEASVRFDTGASDPANGSYVISDIEEVGNVDTSNGAFNDGDSFVFDSPSTDADMDSFTLNVETPDRSQATNASETGTFVTANAQVDGEVVGVAGANVPNATDSNINHDQTADLNTNVSNINETTIGVDRVYRVNATVTDALGVPLNGSDFSEVRVDNTGAVGGTIDYETVSGTSGVNDLTSSEVEINNEDGFFQFDYEPTSDTSNDGVLSPSFEVEAQDDVTSDPTGQSDVTGTPSAQNPVVEVYDRSGAELPTSDDGDEILAQSVENRLRVEAFPASENDFVLPDGQAFGFSDPKAENTAGSTTTRSDDVITPGYDEGQLSFIRVTPTGTGNAVISLTDAVNGFGTEVRDTNGNLVHFDVLSSNLQVEITLSDSSVAAGDNVTATLIQDSTGQTLPANTRVSLVSPDGTEIAFALTNADGEAEITVPEDAPTSGTYTIETRPAGYAPNSVDLNVETPDPPASVTFDDVTVQNGTTTVTVDSARLDDGGFVVIHDSNISSDGAIPSVIGASDYIAPGTTEDVVIELERPITSNETLIAMAHRDTNGNETFDFVTSGGAADGPYTDAGSAVTDSASITVTETTNDLAPYTNEDGVVEASGLQDAAADFRSGDISSGTLLDAAAAFRSGDPVA